ncbi:MAG: L-threonylcarbamoyladenylate synthase [Nitrospinota bacterium]
MAETLPVSPDAPGDAVIGRAAASLRGGGVVALPTDTLYGLCARAEDAGALEKLYAIKGRRPGKGAPVLIGHLDQLLILTQPLNEELWERFYLLWPGPLTLILPARENLSPLLAEKGGVAVRFPDQPLCQTLARTAGPFAATSANPPGEPPLADAASIAARFGGEIDLILDGGPPAGAPPSTVVDARAGAPLLLREGAVPFDKVLEIWGDA